MAKTWPSSFEGLGLGEIFAGVSRNEDSLRGVQGLLLGWRKNLPVESHSPFRAESIPRWVRLDNGEVLEQWDREDMPEALLGWDPGKPPTPAELSHAKQMPGSLVELGDGQRWKIPSFREQPRKHRLDRTAGKWRHEISERYEAFYEAAAGLLEATFEEFDRHDLGGRDFGPDETVPIRLATGCEFVDLALQVNYRVAPPITDALGLWDDDSCAAVTMAAIDMLDIIAVRDQKKRRSLPTSPLGRVSEMAARDRPATG